MYGVFRILDFQGIGRAVVYDVFRILDFQEHG